jgi:hypothetical protein
LSSMWPPKPHDMSTRFEAHGELSQTTIFFKF